MKSVGKKAFCIGAAAVMAVWWGATCSRADLFAPPSVSSSTLVIQLDPAAANVTTNAGGQVSLWTDTTGAGDNYGGAFANATLSQEPLWQASAITNRQGTRYPGLVFNGNYLQAGAPNPAQGFIFGYGMTFFAVVQPTSPNPLGLFDSAPYTGGAWRFYPNNEVQNQNWGGPNNLFLQSGKPQVLTVVTTNDVTDNSLHWEVYLNGVTVTNYTAPNNSGRGVAWLQPVVGGINLGTAGSFNGTISELLMYAGPSALSPADRLAIQQSLIDTFVIPETPAPWLLAMGGLFLLRLRRTRL